jgi:hypothetical protein
VVDRRDRDLVAIGLKPSDRAQDGLMLRRPGEDDRVLRKPAAGAEQREVDGLGTRRGEGDLQAVGVQRLGEGIPSGVQQGARGAALGVEAGGVAGGQVANRGCDLGQDRRGGGVIEVDAGSERR